MLLLFSKELSNKYPALNLEGTFVILKEDVEATAITLH